MGIRALELARTLSHDFEVLLLVPNPAADAREVVDGLSGRGTLGVETVVGRDLAELASGARAAVVSGHAATEFFRQAPDVPVAADLYDPFFIENLHYAPALGDGPARHDFATLRLAAARSDFFLCASPEQRLFYAGLLYAAGRIGPANFPQDPVLAGLLAVVPFGVPEDRANGSRARGRDLARVAPDGPLVLFGGIYDWYDPELLLEAWPLIRRASADAKLLFFESPNPDTTPQRAFARAHSRARELDPQGASIFFSPWVPYADRADLYAATDVIVSLCAEGLETDLAFRTRLLDAAWGGVPSVTAGGGALARELEAAGASRLVSRTPEEIATAMLDLLAGGESPREAARSFAASRAWSLVAAPLVEWCARARIDPGRRPSSGGRRGGWKRFLPGGR